jgi:hypothetical protein
VLGTSERHEHRAAGGRLWPGPFSSGEKRDIARRAVENGDDIGFECPGEPAVHEQQIGVLLRCESYEILARLG